MRNGADGCTISDSIVQFLGPRFNAVAIPLGPGFTGIGTVNVIPGPNDPYEMGFTVVVANNGPNPLDSIMFEMAGDATFTNPEILVLANPVPAGQSFRFGVPSVPVRGCNWPWLRISGQSNAGTVVDAQVMARAF